MNSIFLNSTILCSLVATTIGNQFKAQDLRVMGTLMRGDRIKERYGPDVKLYFESVHENCIFILQNHGYN